MIYITYFEYGGKGHTVAVEDGHTVMEGAVANGIPGIDAECGGACACATCHVYIDRDWWERLTPAMDIESQLLEFAADRQMNSRLSCQIAVTEHLNGLIVRMPATQKS